MLWNCFNLYNTRFNFFKQINNSLIVLILNLLILISIILIAIKHNELNSKLTYFLHSFYIVPVFYLGYEQIHLYIPQVNSNCYDPALAQIDKYIFGVNPTQWIYQFSNSILTEYLQWMYCLFQIIVLSIAVDFYLRRDDKNFRFYTMVIMFGFFSSYLIYFLFPAIGPRFEVHNFWDINKELPGVWATPFLRNFVDKANGVKVGMTDFFKYVNKDCMASGHTMMSLLAVMLSFKLNSKLKWFMLISALSIIISTIYLRYHYTVDIIAGTILAVFVFIMIPLLNKFWIKRGLKSK